MEKEYNEHYYLDYQEIIPAKSKLTDRHKEFVNAYLNKIGIDPEENPLITISPMDSKTFGLQILDVIVEYEKQIKDSYLNMLSRNP
ncbi:MAG: hypothetical protein JXC36_08190 [Candidatus Atribacteria bacterium]|nr:hypothetical protein [Candidatus Atribacteria bacterium]